jgi:clan AA aspartic protease
MKIYHVVVRSHGSLIDFQANLSYCRDISRKFAKFAGYCHFSLLSFFLYGGVMGEVRERFTLMNTGDETNVRRGIIKETELRKTKLRALVDTGATNLVINEKTRQKLGLTVTETGEVTLGNGKQETCAYTEWVTVRWKDRQAVCEAVVLPRAKETLLGVIPLEQMDLKVNLREQKLEGAHGDEWIRYVR